MVWKQWSRFLKNPSSPVLCRRRTSGSLFCGYLFGIKIIVSGLVLIAKYVQHIKSDLMLIYVIQRGTDS